MKLLRTLGISLAIALVLVITVGGSTSALVEQFTIEELTASADSIFVGEVADIASYQEGEGNIYTLVTLSVEQTIKGEPEEEVVIKVPGGELDGLWLWVSDTPSFEPGERFVVFLEEVDGAFGVCGWYQGKFSIRDNCVVERNQSLTSFMADIGRAMEVQGITSKKGTTDKMSVRPASMVLGSPLESKAVEPEKTEELLTGWQNIMTDGFEGEFPAAWTIWVDPGAADAYWGKDSYRFNGGLYSTFCAKSGTAGVDPPINYPNNMNAWMIYGPFDLFGASDAELNFYLWLESQSIYDSIYCMASTNGTDFSGSAWYGDSLGWQSISFDLTNVYTLGNLCGQSQVWIAFGFQSNETVTDDGAFVDDVVLRKYFAGSAPPEITLISPASGPAGTGFQVTISGTNFGATQGTSAVTFWRVGSTYIPAPIVSWSDTEIVCQVPSGASSDNTSNGVRVITSAGTSNDYPFTVTFSYSGQKWFGSNPMGEKFEINPNTADCTEEWQAVINAAQAWNDVDSANFYFEYGGLTSATDYSYNDHNEIMWINYDTGSIATAWRWYNPSTGEIDECDIVFNNLNYIWDTSGSPSGSQMDVQNVATHEMGHWLCLLDLYGNADSEKTMYGFSTTDETKKRTPEAEDIAGMQWIYPGTGTRGQYHLALTNNDDNTLTVYFKSDIDATYYRYFDVPSGQTLTSWWEVVPAGSRQVSIKWTDPDKGMEDFLTSDWLDVPVEGDTEFSFIIPQYPAPNNPPVVSNVTASQGSPTVDISYDVSDAEQSEVTVSFDYWDGASWQPCSTTTGEGTQDTGTGKSGTWNAKIDFNEHYMTDCKIKVTANDGQAENNSDSEESNTFTLDTKDPTGYGCNTPANLATEVSINPDLTCLTASDDSPPISYYFQLAENDTFSQGLQESGWQTETTWSPSTLEYNQEYFWKVKAKDSYDNETDYSPTFSFTTTQVATCDIPLVSGWNLISLPLIPDSTNIEDVLSGVMTNLESAWAYNATTQTWSIYDPESPFNSLTEMTHGFGYWIEVIESCVLTVEGELLSLPHEITLYADWNLIGLPFMSAPQLVDDICAGAVPNLESVWAYNAPAQTWSIYDPESPFNSLTEMTHGLGYWVEVSDQCTITIDGNGPPPLPNAFYGTLLINDSNAPIGTVVEATGTGVVTGLDNPITTIEVGKYGGPGGLDPKLVVQGTIADGAEIEFYVDGYKAVTDPSPVEWHSGDISTVHLTVTIPIPPD